MRTTTIEVYGQEQVVIDLTEGHYFTWIIPCEGDESNPPGSTGSGWFKDSTDHDAGPVAPIGGHDYHWFAGSMCVGYIAWTALGGMKASGHELVCHDPDRGCPLPPVPAVPEPWLHPQRPLGPGVGR
jgi:hypothetical protein